MSTTTTPRRPANAKGPQDRQPKQEKPKVEEVAGGKRVTLRGATVTVLDVAFDDFELLDDLASAQRDKNPAVFPSLLRRLVGDDGYKTALDAIRDGESGRVTLEAGITFVGELFEAINPNS